MEMGVNIKGENRELLCGDGTPCAHPNRERERERENECM
jgi:hypothetical protein